ncbi:hypothetical protein SERLA73DRAFT_181761 [Serpula lacrymans var. lacrymans S7.3]|uniref:VTT domain-containing protein n=2 Tax=Serpula lacrymans var. lacrymans TaxID=341189 RepID=F8PYM6_SERL3|nr:uncharacterized protein SERLADRAFT_468106 [Serpula lacrymans var. lacrymans S7.9]EGN98989.1 hypothetical protein SERLA73DRAFT_181761 [Serpula lacrymans var. lacrymans S7.3]EGO24575.1 hypothetical protein SERLADRAFT_468106 [Serpula lacrymans var. lacrymans S7.9]
MLPLHLRQSHVQTSSSPMPSSSPLQDIHHQNSSSYTLATVHIDDGPSSPHSVITPLLTDEASTYGATIPRWARPRQPSSRRLIFMAALKMAAVFVISTAILGGTLWLALPTLDEDDRPLLRIPKSFAQLQALNSLLKKYRDIYPYRIVICYVVTYLFLQAFSLPGSMYLSILGGAVWGVPRALPLACACVATGATLCYLISAAFGPALLTVPKWKARLDRWSDKIRSQKDNLISFLIVLRIAPLPPHWVVNVICPHVGIGIIPFWISTFFGIFGVSVIHTTIGGGLDEMTSAADFHLISWRNFFLLSAVVVGVLIPVGLRYYFKPQVASAVDVEQGPSEEDVEEEEEDQILAAGPSAPLNKAKTPQLVNLLDEESEDDYEDEIDEDVILEAGPAIVIKNTNSENSQNSRNQGNSTDLI